MDPHIMVLLMPIFLGHNVDDEGFPGHPRSHWSKTKFGLGLVLEKVSKKVPCSEFFIFCVCARERKVEFNSSGVKTCKFLLLETLGDFPTSEFLWNPDWALSPLSVKTDTLFVTEWIDRVFFG